MGQRRPAWTLALAVSSALTLGAGATATAGTETTDPTESTEAADPTDATEATEATETSEAPGTNPSWTVRPGPEQVTIEGAVAGTPMTLRPLDGDHAELQGTADENGALLLRDVAAGTWELTSADDEGPSGEVEVPSLDEVPDASLYTDQTLPAGGFGYLETRDGTTLSINVVLPGPAEDGPYPTVVEYSGYQPSDPAAAAGFAQVFSALGYAYVGVNMRGTGCSGGSFEFFEPVQSLDGYDAIEAIAAQPWVLDHRVGMVGASYPGISQLYVAATQPPSLAAITPLAVLDDAATSVLYPGGILNTGFAVEWAQGRVDESRAEGQPWTVERIRGGDTECEANQGLRQQNPDLVQMIRANPFWTDEMAAPLAPRLFVDRIEVPVFLAGSWQDEQTGGRFATMLDQFTGTDHLYVDLVNGLHVEALSAGVFPRYVEFLELYVAERVPQLAAAASVSPMLTAAVFGTDEVELPEDRFAGVPYEDALAWFENEQPVRVLFEEGAADDEQPGTPQPRFVERFDEYPIASATPHVWYLGDGSLNGDAPVAPGGVSSYTADPDALPATFFDDTTGSVWAYDVTWDWRQPPEGTAASFLTGEFAYETFYIGSASADLWIRSSAPDTDLEVTVSEVRADGQEVYVQSGWLRASQRALDEERSTALRPVATHLQSDAADLPSDEWTLARVEIFPFAHVFRPGSRLRLTVDAPGNSRASWVFETIADGETVEIAWDPEHPSSLVMPLVVGLDAPDSLPTCSLRGQPCRAYEE